MVYAVTGSDAVKMPAVDMGDMRDGNKDRFAEKLGHALFNVGFVALSGIDPEVARLRDELHRHLQKFFSLGHDVKSQYRIGADGQRGYTPLGVEQSGTANYGADTEKEPGKEDFTEWREHIMTGERIPPGHPLEAYQRRGYQPNNRLIKEVPELIPTAEQLQVALQETELLLYEGAEIALGLKHGTLAAVHVYGNSSIRSHYYPAIPREDILGENEEPRGYKTLRARVFDPMIKDYRTFNRLIRAAPHKDVDTSAFLLGATRRGLRIKARGGGFIPFTAEPDQIVFNGGDYMEHVTGGHWPSPLHFVELDASMAEFFRTSIVLFSHPRLCSVVGPVGRFATPENERSYPPTLEGVLLYRRLKAIGYPVDLPTEEAKVHETNRELSDEKLVDKILSWEDANGVNRLRRYYPKKKD